MVLSADLGGVLYGPQNHRQIICMIIVILSFTREADTYISRCLES